MAATSEKVESTFLASKDGIQEGASKSLSINAQGRLKWNGNFDDFSRLIDEVVDVLIKWSAAGGSCKMGEGQGLTVRWYQGNGSITLKGEKAIEVQSKLLSLIQFEGRKQNYNIQDYKVDKDISEMKTTRIKCIKNQMKTSLWEMTLHLNPKLIKTKF